MSIFRVYFAIFNVTMFKVHLVTIHIPHSILSTEMHFLLNMPMYHAYITQPYQS